MKRNIFFFLIIIFLSSFAYAEDITLSLNQTDYYFKVGNAATITLESSNTYGENIPGTLEYTVSQNIQQGNMQYANSNTKSTTFTIPKGNVATAMGFGTSQTPATFDVSMQFIYNKNGTQKVSLNTIHIYFVNDTTQKNQQQTTSSSSQQQNQNSAEEQMQEKIDEMLQNQQQNTENKLQNSQLSQDSSALKQEMTEQIQKEEHMQKAFQEKLASNQEFQKEHQQLLEEGYNLTGGEVKPSNTTSGEFSLDYQNKEGESASLQGEMTNGDMTQLDKETPQSRQEALETLQENKKFNKYQKELQEQGYKQQNTEFSTEDNTTTVKMNYQNELNETATITADIKNESVEHIELDANKEESFPFLLIVIFVLVGLASYFLYKKFKKNNEKVEEEKEQNQEIPFDYKKESKQLLALSKKAFEEKQHKDAYGLAAQSLRTYLSYENKLNKETTNDEIIFYLRKHKKSYQKIKECFDLCSLVEFAKYKANKKDFTKIVKEVEKNVIGKKS